MAELFQSFVFVLTFRDFEPSSAKHGERLELLSSLIHRLGHLGAVRVRRVKNCRGE